jgi:hypothetical protein
VSRSDSDSASELLTYRQRQLSGPGVDINNEDSLNPTVTIPENLDGDARIILQLEPDYQGRTQDRDVVTIFVEHTKEAQDIEQETLGPSGDGAIEWSSERCGGDGDVAGCMCDGSDNTFASASPDDISSINFFSFEELLGAGGDGEAEIEYVTAKVTAKKTSETGFLSLVAAADSKDAQDEDYEATPAISILSDSFSEYELVWEENPATNRAWTADSLSSFIAGYICMYAAGQSDIQVSEFSLAVTFTTVEKAQASEEETPTATEAIQDVDDDDESCTIEINC